MTTRIRPLLVNGHEILLDRELGRAAEAAGYQVSQKVRVADVFEIEGSGLTNEQYGYALRAHFDFVVTEGEERIPQFAVEFDGPLHDTDARTAARDAIKDAICEHFGLPILRIDGTFLRPVKRKTLVGLLVEAWGMYQGFMAAQAAGQVPLDEPWCYFSVLEVDPATGRLTEPLALDSEGRVLMHQLHAKGVTAMPGPASLVRFDDGQVATSYATVELADGTFITAEAHVRTFRFPPIGPHELAEDLAVENLRSRIRLWMAGHNLAVGRDVVERIRREHPTSQGWHLSGSMHDAWVD